MAKNKKKKRGNHFVALGLNPADVFVLHPRNNRFLTGKAEEPDFIFTNTGCGLVFSLASWVVSSCVLGILIISLLMPFAITRFGTAATAQLRIKDDTIDPKSKAHFHYTFSYRYFVGGQRYEPEQEVSSTYYAEHSDGDILSIRYLPFWPAELTIVDEFQS